jgi:hypothetical protein
MRHPSEKELVLYRCGAAPDREAIRSHLETCQRCGAEYGQLERLFAALDAAAEPPPRPAEYGAQVWRRLQTRLQRPGRIEWSTWLRPRAWALAGGLAALLVAAFLAGRGSRPAPQLASSIAPQVRERILLVAVGDHLERSQMVLIELINASAAGPVDISAEQRWSAELLPANRLYRVSAARAGEAGVASVLEELERTLLEIAHGPAELEPADLERLRERIEARGILFKLRVISSHVPRRAAAAPLSGVT